MTDEYLIVTPTLGASRFLDETVRSVAALRLPIRHLLVAPAAQVGALRARYPATFATADRGPRHGLYGALNAALDAASEDWTWFSYINDDDALLPGLEWVARRHERLARPEPVVYGDVALIDETSRRISRVTVEPRPARIPALLKSGISPLTQQGMLFHRAVVKRLGGFDPGYRLCADLDFWLRAYVSGARFRYYPRAVAAFRLRGGQLSGDTASTRREQAKIVARHLPQPVGPFARVVARLGYRMENLPRYLARWRSRGWRTSYELLEGSGRSRTECQT